MNDIEKEYVRLSENKSLRKEFLEFLVENKDILVESDLCRIEMLKNVHKTLGLSASVYREQADLAREKEAKGKQFTFSDIVTSKLSFMLEEIIITDYSLESFFIKKGGSYEYDYHVRMINHVFDYYYKYEHNKVRASFEPRKGLMCELSIIFGIASSYDKLETMNVTDEDDILYKDKFSFILNHIFAKYSSELEEMHHMLLYMIKTNMRPSPLWKIQVKQIDNLFNLIKNYTNLYPDEDVFNNDINKAQELVRYLLKMADTANLRNLKPPKKGSLLQRFIIKFLSGY